jgi:hypothetical protein
MFLLKNLNSKELKIIEENQNSKAFHAADQLETKMFSSHSANLVGEWKDSTEDEVWK